MKKILFLLLISVTMYGQVPADATPLENIQLTNNVISTTAPSVIVQESNGVLNKINKSDIVNYIEVASAVNLPVTGVAGKLYLTRDNNRLYRWNGIIYNEITDFGNKQNSLTIDGTGQKFPTVDAINAVLPASYSKIVYVNTTSPTTATIFDLENPPVTNDNDLKIDVNNLYIGTDASTWVYQTSPASYVTKTISSATSNFNTFGTTVDAGNSKTSHITRSGAVTLTGSLNLATAKISSTPTTSASSYDILTRNAGTGVVEKISSSGLGDMTLGTAQTVTARKTFNSNNTTAGGIGIVNNKTTSTSYGDNAGLTIVGTGSVGILVDGSFGTGIRALAGTAGTYGIYTSAFGAGSYGFYSQNQDANAVGIYSKNESTGVGMRLENLSGASGRPFQYLKAGSEKIFINDAGDFSAQSITVLGTLGLRNVANTFTSLFTNTNTASRTYTLPNRDMTFAGTDEISNVQRNIIKDATVSSTITGVSGGDILAKSYLIPADIFSANDIMTMYVEFNKTGVTNTAVYKIWKNTTNSLAGATQIATFTTIAANLTTKMGRNFTLRGGNMMGNNSTSSLVMDLSSNSNFITTTAFGTTVDNYIIVSINLTGAGDTAIVSSVKITN